MTLDRRGWLRLAGGVTLAAALPGCGDDWLDIGIRDGDDYDTVLDHVHETHPEIGLRLSNHAPMAMDALVALGRGDRIARWTRRYARILDPLPAGDPLPLAQRPCALGDHALHAEWIATYLEDAAALSPRALIARDFATLAPAWAAQHGVLRTAHALRALDRADTPSRRRELAHALGYWACRHDLPQGPPGVRPVAGLDVVSALAAVPLLPEDRRSGGIIIEQLAAVQGDAAFADAVAAVDLDALPHDDALHELVCAAARLYVHDGRNDIALLHGVTATSALGLMWPWLDDASRRLGLGHAFQTVAALHAACSKSPGVPDAVDASRTSIDELLDRCADSSDEHQIKLGEAALREYAAGPRPELLAAIELVLR